MLRSASRLFTALLTLLVVPSCTQREKTVVPTEFLPIVKAHRVPDALAQVRLDRYELVSDATLLPADVRAALAREFGEATLEMASGAEPFNGGCLIQPGLPRRRLLLSAVSPRYAVVHFEEGGFAVAWDVIVFQRSDDGSCVRIWTNHTRTAWSEPETFRAALRSGELLDDAWKDPLGVSGS